MKLHILSIILFLLISSSCHAQQVPSDWEISPELNDGWQTTNPASVGLIEDSLGNLIRLIWDNEHQDFRSLIVIKDGKLVMENYFFFILEN